MATKTTSIHRANDSNGFSVSFQLDHEVGANHAQLLVMHSSPGRMRNVEIDVPLSEFPELIKSLQLILDETPIDKPWCAYCMGSGEVPISAVNTAQAVPCTMCGGKGIARD